MKQQSGNVLWFILIAVALLAALTFVMSRGASHTNQTGNVEQNRIKMSQVIRYAKSIEAGVQQLLLRGCSESDISFENSFDASYVNPNSPADKSCHVFDAAGAGLTWQEFGEEDLVGASSNIAFMSNFIIQDIEGNSPLSGNDLIIAIHLPQSVCEQINKDLNLSILPANIHLSLDLWENFFYGVFTLGYTIGGVDAPALSGQPSGCVIDDSGHYVFYHVLIAR